MCVKRFTSWKVESTSIWSDSRRVSIEGNFLCLMNATPSPPTMTSSQVSLCTKALISITNSLKKLSTVSLTLSNVSLCVKRVNHTYFSVSVQTAGTAAVPGTSTNSVPPSCAASWFCRVPAADRADTPPAASPVKPKDRLRARRPPPLRITKRSASAPMDVPESLRMRSGRVTVGHRCSQPHEKCWQGY